MSTPTPLPNAVGPHPHGAHTPAGTFADPPLALDSPTIGLKLNHLCIRIRDPVPSLHFYINLLGMRTVFTMNVGPWTIYYLGYPQTDAHRSDPAQYGADTHAKLAHTLGLLELYHIHGSEKDEEFKAAGGYRDSTGNTPPHLGLAHLGFTAPDVGATLERLRAEGVEVVKELGVCTRESIPLSQWEDDRGWAKGEIHENYARVFRQIAFVRDPDGYVVELVPQNMKR